MARKPIVVGTSHFIDGVETRIDKEYEARRSKNGAPFKPEELLAAAEGADAMLVTLGDRIDAEFLKRVSASVKVIATYSVGYDHIDLRAAAERKIAIAFTPGVETDAVADLTMLLLLGASRRAYEAQQLVRSGAWKSSSATALLGWQPTGKNLGIFGMGHIGQAVARRARAFGMKIHYYNPVRLPEGTAGDAVFHADQLDLLRVSAFLSLNAPDSKETHHFLNARTLQLLPPGAIVVNTARGGLIVDEELIAALQSGHVAAAGLEVYEGEPKLHPGYLALKNTFLLPHIGSATVETRTAMGMLALANIEAVLSGNPAPSLVTTN